jgi:hypothetical protein
MIESNEKKELAQHILRTDPIITQQILQYKPTGYRDTGRPWRRREDDIWTGRVMMAYLGADDDDDDDIFWSLKGSEDGAL